MSSKTDQLEQQNAQLREHYDQQNAQQEEEFRERMRQDWLTWLREHLVPVWVAQ